MFHQNAALARLAEVPEQFTMDYNGFATAVDSTRHRVQMKNFFIGDEHEFLGYSFFFLHVMQYKNG